VTFALKFLGQFGSSLQPTVPSSLYYLSIGKSGNNAIRDVFCAYFIYSFQWLKLEKVGGSRLQLMTA